MIYDRRLTISLSMFTCYLWCSAFVVSGYSVQLAVLIFFGFGAFTHLIIQLLHVFSRQYSSNVEVFDKHTDRIKGYYPHFGPIGLLLFIFHFIIMAIKVQK